MRIAALGTLVVLGSVLLGAQATSDDKDDRPTITLKATPVMSFSPARVSLRAELKGGADDFEEYYCSTIEWSWGDGTSSESSIDCEPYVSGKSEIRRYYSRTHTFSTSGRFEVRFKMKKNEKVVGLGHVVVQVRPGIRDMSPFGNEP